MREATGNLNLTVITIIAIVAISVIFVPLIYPPFRRAIVTHTCEVIYEKGCLAVKSNTGNPEQPSSWICNCPTMGELPLEK